MPANLLNRHPTDLQQACIAFVKQQLRLESPHCHSVYGQTRVDRRTAAVEQFIVVHRHPTRSTQQFLSRAFPESFNGYPVIEEPWPDEDL